jgi:hypothetical protein
MVVMKSKAIQKGTMKVLGKKFDIAGRKAAIKATTMTKEQWQRHQVGMKEKWPKPKYMATPVAQGHNCPYRDETFEIATRFTAETKLAYRPHAKAPGTKSHVRYEKYSKAKTVGESLKKGSLPADWCWDIEKGFIKVLGPLRKEPLAFSEVVNDSKLTAVDRAVMNWFRKELAKKLGLDNKDLGNLCANESLIMRAHRLSSVREAKAILEDCKKKKRIVSDEDLEKVLRHWGFARNESRINVMRKGQTYVYSDTLGLIRDRCGDIHLTKSTLRYPAFVQLMSKWLTDRLPATEAAKFKWTSFNVNKDYNGKIHRDGNNFGPSMISAFGEFTGGKLNYYVHDTCDMKVELLEKNTSKKPAVIDLKNYLAMLNGNTAHSVDDFKGNRFSIVFFTLGCHQKMKKEDRQKLINTGVPAPMPEESPYSIICPPHGERSNRRYKDTDKQKANLPAYRSWAKTKLSLKKRKGGC